jgi:hypothetical protein
MEEERHKKRKGRKEERKKGRDLEGIPLEVLHDCSRVPWGQELPFS